MAAPTPHPPVDETVGALGDGFPTRIVFSSVPDLHIEEVEVTPLEYDGGDPLNMTNHRNKKYHTKAPQKLIDTPPISVVVNYATSAMPQLVALINVPDTITIWHPDNAHEAFYGYLKSVKRAAQKFNEKPTATIEIVPTNRDPVTCVEAGPVWVAASGTGATC
jgi:hypothetical protein